MDSALLPSALLIKAARVCETVAEHHPCQARGGLDDCRKPAGGFTKGWIGVPPQRKERRKQPRKPMTAITTLLNPIPSDLSWRKRPYGAGREPCALKNRREALDKNGSFRDGDTHRL